MVNWGSKSLWVMAGMVSFVLITFAITFSIQLGTQSNTHAKSPPANNDINETSLSSLFQTFSSRACIFVYGVYTDVHGVLSWEQKHPHERNISLSENKTHVITMTDGFYLVFVQVTYKINCSQATEYTDLMLTVNHFYEEGEQYYSAVFKTHCGTCGGCQQKGDPESVDVVLSQPTLLWMKQNDKLTVTVSHREFVEFIYYPTSTFLMVVKYSD
ncbi:uncharacterized protein LOC125719687 isoform X1 [Brienomyrus brachyistius]|uniref:uncharacterized protein LOC125719687 isoform X1 n=1 Tax=Brienomyrus brachyistius TaxID=42636 RepID=UPI0020B33900|nr:uncharacterized protein LOC125719687 isoform X1 [Brienomyrus brachyistius]